MIGICWMLAWLGVSAMGQRRRFWTAENLMATVFHGDTAIRRGFASSTPSGLALYLLAYSLQGGLFASLIRARFTSLGTVRLGVLFSVGWYCLWFRPLVRTLTPLAWLLHAENNTGPGPRDFRIFAGPLPGLPAAAGHTGLRGAGGGTSWRDHPARSAWNSRNRIYTTYYKNRFCV
jgi:hypothetical protein